MRDRLIELLDKAFLESDDNYGRPNTDQVADHLLANGVIVLPEKALELVDRQRAEIEKLKKTNEKLTEMLEEAEE